MKFKLIKKVPIVEIDGKRCFLDTGFPGAFMPTGPGVHRFFGIPGLQVAGVQALKRYTKFDYRNSEITTSDEPISLEGGIAVPFEVRPNGWLVKMTVGGVEGMRYIDTGAAFSYVHNSLPAAPSTNALLTAGLGRRRCAVSRASSQAIRSRSSAVTPAITRRGQMVAQSRTMA